MSPRTTVAFLALCCVSASPMLRAQAPSSAPSTAPVDAGKSLDVQLAAIEKDVVSLAEALPADKYSFAPANSDFVPAMKPDYTGVRTFGQEVAHVAQANYFYGSMFSGLKPTIDVASIGKGIDKEAAVASLRASFAFLHQAWPPSLPQMPSITQGEVRWIRVRACSRQHWPTTATTTASSWSTCA